MLADGRAVEGQWVLILNPPRRQKSAFFVFCLRDPAE
jgi:hypothetical protein